MSQRLIRRPVILVTCTVLWTLGLLVVGSDAGCPFEWLVVLGYSGAALVLWWLVRAVVDIIRLRRGGVPSPSRARYQRSYLALAFALATVVVSTQTYMALRARVWLSSDTLTTAVSTIVASEKARSEWRPARVGLFRISEVEALPGGARLITTACGFDDCGLAFWEGGSPPTTGENSYTHLYGPWWRWRRSW